MSQNEIVLERIRKYQEEPVFHELTCGTDSCRSVLKGRENEEKIELYCPNCSYIQENVPNLFFQEAFEKAYQQQKDLLDSLGDTK